MWISYKQKSNERGINSSIQKQPLEHNSSREYKDGNNKTINITSVIQRNDQLTRIKNFSIILKTDANVNISIDIPIKDICMVSEVALKKISIDGDFYADMSQIDIIKQGYIDLYQRMDIKILDSRVELVEPNDT